MKEKKYDITVFTSTYNRAYIIDNLYNSLKKQDFNSFEWVVIDDGSQDNTNDLFEKWTKEERKFAITYLYKSNGGKQRAINEGVALAKGRLFFIVDSDDFIPENSLSKIMEMESTIGDKIRYAGIGGLKANKNNQIIGTTFREHILDSTSLEFRKKGYKGDKAEVFYTDILKKYKFPQYEDENFVPENLVWNRIANDGLLIRWFNEIIYNCEYLPDGLTKNVDLNLMNNFKGYTLSCKERITYDISFKERVMCIGNYTRRANMKGLKLKNISKNLNCKILECLIYGVLAKFYFKIRRG